MSGLLASLLMAVGLMKVYVEDVFSAYTYTGNGSTQTITTGIPADLTWLKGRAGGPNSGADAHWLFDTARGNNHYLSSNSTGAQDYAGASSQFSFTSTGFSVGNTGVNGINNSGETIVAWNFAKQAKFFDEVTYTGNGVSGRSISHALGIAPGMYVVKRTDNTGSWCVWHRSIGTNGLLVLNGTQASSTASTYVQTADASTFTIGNDAEVNGNGNSYVAYLFAHDTGTDGMIQCGSFTTDGSGNATVTLGWEPQFIEIKRVDSTGNWQVRDSARGMCAASTGQGSHQLLLENDSGAETASGTSDPIVPTSTGFKSVSNTASATFVYRAIRAPMKVPTDATKVFKSIAGTGTGASAQITGAGFIPDVVLSGDRNTARGHGLSSRLRGAKTTLRTWDTGADTSDTQGVTSFDMDGITVGDGSTFGGNFNVSAETYIHHLFKRAPGFMQEVCYTGTGAVQAVAHGLGVTPELMLGRCRTGTRDWRVYFGVPGDTLKLNGNNAAQSISSVWNSTAPTASVFTLGSDGDANASGVPGVMFLFATCPGVSKVGGYIGTGTTLQIDCGFAAGARFVLIKRTTVATGDWYIWDTVRGIVSGNDPYLLLNSTAAEVTSTDYIDPYSAGFEISSSAPSAINASGGTFIFLAIA